MRIKDKFPAVLRNKLKIKYGHIPSCTMFANHFNLRTLSDKTITRETARRWLNGESFPHLDNFYTLTNWLSFNEDDLTSLFDLNKKQSLEINQINKDFVKIYNCLQDKNKSIIFGVTELLIEHQNKADN